MMFFFVQELMYFIIFKYALSLPDEKIKKALNRAYRNINYCFRELNDEKSNNNSNNK